jgi:hypothetical protein
MGCVAAAVLGGVLRAEVDAGSAVSYGVIQHRNAFGLNPVPVPKPVVVAPTNPVVPKSTVQFSGISVTRDGAYALLVLPVGPGRTNTGYLRLRVNDQQEGIQVVEIDPKARRVKIMNAGTLESLSLTNNAPPLVASPIAPGAGVPGVAVPGRPGVPTAQPHVIPTPASRLPSGAVPTAPVPSGGVPGASVPSAVSAPAVQRVGVGAVSGSGAANVVINPGMEGTVVPARPIRTEEVPTVSPEVQYLMLKAQEEAARSAGVPFPPTPPLPH